MDRQSVYTLSLFPDERSDHGDLTNKQTQKELVDFILDFHLENVFIYRYEPWQRESSSTCVDDDEEIKYGRMCSRSNTTVMSTWPI